MCRYRESEIVARVCLHFNAPPSSRHIDKYTQVHVHWHFCMALVRSRICILRMGGGDGRNDNRTSAPFECARTNTYTQTHNF